MLLPLCAPSATTPQYRHLRGETFRLDRPAPRFMQHIGALMRRKNSLLAIPAWSQALLML
jgi:hypothetical protein